MLLMLMMVRLRVVERKRNKLSQHLTINRLEWARGWMFNESESRNGWLLSRIYETDQSWGSTLQSL